MDNFQSLNLSMSVDAFMNPAYVGYWEVGGVNGLRICSLKRPRWLTRVLCKALLEFKWVDIKKGGAA